MEKGSVFTLYKYITHVHFISDTWRLLLFVNRKIPCYLNCSYSFSTLYVCMCLQ